MFAQKLLAGFGPLVETVELSFQVVMRGDVQHFSKLKLNFFRVLVRQLEILIAYFGQIKINHMSLPHLHRKTFY